MSRGCRDQGGEREREGGGGGGAIRLVGGGQPVGWL